MPLFSLRHCALFACTLALACVPAARGDDLLDPTEWNLQSSLITDGRILGLFRESDHQFSDFISPMTNPVYFEDPRTLTEARAIFINHSIPDGLGGGSVQLYATQLRAALTENLSIIATKDGYIVSESPLLDDGFADVSAGLKLNVFKDVQSQTLLSVGTVFEIPAGSHTARQGNGSGEFHLFATGGTEFLPTWHFVSGSGFRLPTDTSAQNQMWYWSSHIDKKIGHFYAFTECNWYYYMSSGNGLQAPIGGGDLFNLGSVAMAGQSAVTGAYGVKYKPNQHLELGVAYEIPYSQRRDLLQNRLTVDLILRY
jgi:hypothetical protein